MSELLRFVPKAVNKIAKSMSEEEIQGQSPKSDSSVWLPPFSSSASFNCRSVIICKYTTQSTGFTQTSTALNQPSPNQLNM